MSSTRPEPKGMSPQRPNLQLSRSISEISPPSHRSHRHYPHPHLHRHDREEKATQSAHPHLHPHASSLFDKLDNITKSEVVTPNESRSGSRRDSLLISEEQNGMAEPQQARLIREGRVRDEREKSVLRATELRKSLLDLNQQSNNITSRLDLTYYSVLEKLSILQSTISTLKDLASMTRAINTDFQVESSALIQETSNQLASFSYFTPQETKITNLESRISAGREKVSFLATRVSLVQEKLDRWEKVESEWRMRTRNRLKVLWVIMSVVLAILLGLLIFQYTPARNHGAGVLKGYNVSNFSIDIKELEESLENETMRLKRRAEDALEKLMRASEEEEEDPRLRLFDEL